MKIFYKIPNKTLIIICCIILSSIFNNSLAQDESNKTNIEKAEKIAIQHSEFMIKRDFENAVKLMLPSDLKQLEKDILMILNEGREYGVILPFSSGMNIDKEKKLVNGSILIKYYENAYGKEIKDYHSKVINSLKVIEATAISKNTVKVRYSFDAYGADEPVNLEYDKILFYDNNKWHVTQELPVGRMVANLKKRIELKKKQE